MKSAQWVTGIAGAMLVFATITAHAGLDNSDVTFNGANANSFVAGVPSNQSGTTTQDYANTNTLFGYNDWSFAVQDKAGNASTSGTVNGFTFSLTAGTGNGQKGTLGSWGLNVQDANNNDLLTIPFEMDFVVYLFGGNNGAFYFFDNETINASNAGTFQINFVNNSGQFPKLSHITLLVRDMHNVENGGGGSSEVPEPASMLLFGAGLLGLGLSRRRSKLA